MLELSKIHFIKDGREAVGSEENRSLRVRNVKSFNPNDDHKNGQFGFSKTLKFRYIFVKTLTLMNEILIIVIPG